MKRPISINRRDYFYETKIAEGEFSDSHYTEFFIKVEPIQKRIVKRKFILFGPVIEDKIVDVDNYRYCFTVNVSLRKGSIITPSIIKHAEDQYNSKVVVTDKKLEL